MRKRGFGDRQVRTKEFPLRAEKTSQRAPGLGNPKGSVPAQSPVGFTLPYLARQSYSFDRMP